MLTPIKSFNTKKIIDLLIRLIVLYILFNWCFDILRPFVTILIWAVIISITVYPLYNKLGHLFGQRHKISAFLLTTLLISFIVIPTWLLFESLFSGIQEIRNILASGGKLIPAPDQYTQNWPAYTKPVIDLWETAYLHIDQLMVKYAEQLATAGKWILKLFSSIGFGVLELVGSIIVAGILLTYTSSLLRWFILLYRKLAGKQGTFFLKLSIVTIRNVMKGIIGIAFIQTIMTALALFIGGVPFAGLWTLVALVLAIAQVGIGPVGIISIIYMWGNASTTAAIIFTIWMVLTMVIDNVLKPIMLGRNSPVPTLVIFLGAIGGFLHNGFIGLFMGSVILALGYKLLSGWLEERELKEIGKSDVQNHN